MKRISTRDRAEILDYHLIDGRAPEFTYTQAGRIELAHFLVDKILRKDLQRRPLVFVELGCGAGDITGPYSNDIEVHGYDVTPMAQETCARRWPNMHFTLAEAETIKPFDCDLLVLCEFLEHIEDPQAIVEAWLPKAKWAIIGHPLNEPDERIEPGHNWSYDLEDWENWFPMGNHRPFERFMFPMGGWHDMVMGHSARLDQPAWRNVHPDTRW